MYEHPDNLPASPSSSPPDPNDPKEGLVVFHHQMVGLTEDRQKELHQELVESTRELDRLKERQKEMMDNHRKAQKFHEKRAFDTARTLEAGQEMITVEHRKIFQPIKGTVLIKEVKSGEIVTERLMTDEEKRQLYGPKGRQG